MARKKKGSRAYLSIEPDVIVEVRDADWEPVIGATLQIPGGTELSLVGEDGGCAVLVPRDPYLPPCRVAVPLEDLARRFTVGEPGSGPRANAVPEACSHEGFEPRCAACFWRWWRGRAVDAGKEDLVGGTIKQDNGVPPRLRAASTVDMSKAKPSCNRCHGTGRVGYRAIDDPEHPGQTARVPVVCRCVTRRGGVKRDILDRMIEQVNEQLHSGAFAKTLAADIRRLPPDKQPLAIGTLRRQADDERKDPIARKAIQDALRELEEDPHGIPREQGN